MEPSPPPPNRQPWETCARHAHVDNLAGRSFTPTHGQMVHMAITCQTCAITRVWCDQRARAHNNTSKQGFVQIVNKQEGHSLQVQLVRDDTQPLARLNGPWRRDASTVREVFNRHEACGCHGWRSGAGVRARLGLPCQRTSVQGRLVPT